MKDFERGSVERWKAERKRTSETDLWLERYSKGLCEYPEMSLKAKMKIKRLVLYKWLYENNPFVVTLYLCVVYVVALFIGISK